MIRSIQAVNDPVTGVVQRYIVTISEYDYPNVDGQDPFVSGVTNMNHLGEEKHWQAFEIQGPDDAGLRFTIPPDDPTINAPLASDTVYKMSEGNAIRLVDNRLFCREFRLLLAAWSVE